MRAAPIVLGILCLSALILASCMREDRVNYRVDPSSAYDRYAAGQEKDRWSGESDDQQRNLLVGGVVTTGDRDLGPGADGERLGDRQWQVARHEPEPTPGESYAQLADNPFMSASRPGGDTSTFSLDVDTASYANCRRFIQEMGRLPPRGAVRIEELINTIRYDYPGPDAEDGRPFRAMASVSTCPWRQENRLVRIALKAREVQRSRRQPLNLVFLIDTSGSMEDANKLPLVKESLNGLKENLGADDRLAIVTYAGSAGVALRPTPGDQHGRIRSVINGLSAEGSTNGAGGIEAAYAEAERNMAPGTTSRVILCTDGDFNVGTTGLADLKRLIERERTSGIFLNVYGFGMGNLKDRTLETLADAGNGVYGYIDGRDEANRLFSGDAMGQLVTVAKDAKVQVFFNPAAVAAWRLIGYENRMLRREDFNNDRVDAGDIGAGHTVTALYEIVPVSGALASGDANPFLVASDRRDPIDPSMLLRLRLRYKEPEGETSRLMEIDVPAVVGAMDRDFRFAAAVAGFGMLLRASPYRGACDWDLVQSLASSGQGDDHHGQRREFAELVARARELAR